MPDADADERYEIVRSADLVTHVICYDAGFYDDVPIEARQKGPWTGIGRGPLTDLRPEPRRG